MSLDLNLFFFKIFLSRFAKFLYLTKQGKNKNALSNIIFKLVPEKNPENKTVCNYAYFKTLSSQVDHSGEKQTGADFSLIFLSHFLSSANFLLICLNFRLVMHSHEHINIYDYHQEIKRDFFHRKTTFSSLECKNT